MSRAGNGRGRRLVAVVIGVGCVAACSASPKTRAGPEVVLQSADLPAGYVATGQWQPPNTAQHRQMSVCLGTPTSAASSETASAVFTGPDELVATSITDIFPSASASMAGSPVAAGTGVCKVRRRAGESDLRSAPWRRDLRQPDRVADAISEGRRWSGCLPFHLPVTSGGQRTTAIADVVTVVHGAVEVTVSFVGTSDPSAALQEQAVVTKILART